MAPRLTSRERTYALIATIDETLAGIGKQGKTRSYWTTPEIENLLLDIRNEAKDLQEMADAYAWIDTRLAEMKGQL